MDIDCSTGICILYMVMHSRVTAEYKHILRLPVWGRFRERGREAERGSKIDAKRGEDDEDGLTFNNRRKLSDPRAPEKSRAKPIHWKTAEIKWQKWQGCTDLKKNDDYYTGWRRCATESLTKQLLTNKWVAYADVQRLDTKVTESWNILTWESSSVTWTNLNDKLDHNHYKDTVGKFNPLRRTAHVVKKYPPLSQFHRVSVVALVNL